MEKLSELENEPGLQYDRFVKTNIKKLQKKYPEYDRETILKKIAHKYVKKYGPITDEKERPTKKSYWLVFDKDEGNREDCNTYYCEIMYCYTKQEALTIMAVKYDVSATRYEARKMKLRTINTMNKDFLNND